MYHDLGCDYLFICFEIELYTHENPVLFLESDIQKIMERLYDLSVGIYIT